MNTRCVFGDRISPGFGFVDFGGLYPRRCEMTSFHAHVSRQVSLSAAFFPKVRFPNYLRFKLPNEITESDSSQVFLPIISLSAVLTELRQSSLEHRC